MSPILIKTFNPANPLPKHHFFVLCKGENSGRPSVAPCPNCFVVGAPTVEEKETLYWLSYALWKGKAFHPLLRGSVIPFIVIKDYRHQLQGALGRVAQAAEQLPKVVQVLRQLDEKETLARQQLKAFGQVREVLLRKFLQL